VLLAWIVLLAMGIGAGNAEAQMEFVLVQDGVPMSRVTTQSSSPVVAFAASELQRYVKAMSGADLTGGNLITLAVDPALGWDAYRIMVTPKTVLISGGNERGVLYGVYELLEEMGCRFLALGPEGENVPHRQTLNVRAGRRRSQQPALRYRGLIVQRPLAARHLDMADWMAKNRMNYWVIPNWAFGTDVQLRQSWVDALEKRGILWEHGHHSFSFWITQGAREPEVLGLKNGHRSQAAICISTPRAAEKVAENMAAFAARWPQTDVLSLWPNDQVTGWCECEPCKTLYGQLPTWRGGTPLMTRPYFWFLERVAESLTRRGVRQPITGLAYNNTLEPVSGLAFPDNLLVTVAPIQRNYARPIGSLDYFGPVMEQWTALLGERSQNTGARVMAYEYYAGMYASNSLPFPTVTALADDIERYMQTGFGGITTQAEEGHWGTYALDFYALARMSYHGAQDPRRLIADFSRDYYGPAAAPMTEYWTRQEEMIRSQQSVLPNGQFFGLLHRTPGAIDALDRLVAQAEILTDSDVVRSRVHLSRLSMDYVKLLRDAIDAGKGEKVDALPPTPKGTGFLPEQAESEFVQLRFPVPLSGSLEIALGNVVPMSGKGWSYQLEIRRDAPSGLVIHTGKLFTSTAAEAERSIAGRAWALSNSEPLDVTGHLDAADRDRGFVDLFVTAKVQGDAWTLYRDTDDGGQWDIQATILPPSAATDRAEAWERLKIFVEQNAASGILNQAPDLVLKLCKQMVNASR